MFFAIHLRLKGKLRFQASALLNLIHFDAEKSVISKTDLSVFTTEFLPSTAKNIILPLAFLARGVLMSTFARYVPLTSQNPPPPL